MMKVTQGEATVTNRDALIKVATELDQLLKTRNLNEATKLAIQLRKADQSAGLAYLGLIAYNEEKWEEAEAYLIESFQINPQQNLALANLIPTYIKLRNSKKAVAYGEQAHRAMPKNFSVAQNYAAALMLEQQQSKALEVLLPHHDPSKPNLTILTYLISIYRALFERDKVEEIISIAENHFANAPELEKIRADKLTEGDPIQAKDALKAIIEKDPSIVLKWNLSLLQLRCGEYDEGWINYDNGLLPEVGKIGRPLPAMFDHVRKITDFDGISNEKWIVAICEQGIGDQVLFLGVLSYFIQQFPKTALICEKRMAPILKRSFPTIPLYSYGIGSVLANNTDLCSGVAPIGSIQKLYRKTLADFESHRESYLIPDVEKVKKYREILQKNIGEKRIIGISWKGGYWERAQRTKTLELELWGPILETNDAVFVSLQYGDISKEKDYVNSKYSNVRFIDGVDFKKDLDGWFAVACACDEIISVSTAVVHFAGAAGKKVHLLLSDKGAPFIWGLDGKKSVAYPDVNIYRKRQDETSEQYFRAVAGEIFPTIGRSL
jgi:tetratricopeptide (TPR) repeat protein